MGGACSTYGGDEKCMQGFGGETWGKETFLVDLEVDVRTILWWIFKKWDVGHGLYWSGSGYGQVTSTCEGGNESTVSVRCGEFLD